MVLIMPGHGSHRRHPFLSNGSPEHTRPTNPPRGGGWTPEAELRALGRKREELIPSHTGSAAGATHSVKERGQELFSPDALPKGVPGGAG